MIRHSFVLRSTLRVFSSSSSGAELLSKAVGNGMTYYEARPKQENRKVVVITGWLNANQRQLKPYVSYYLGKGLDTVTISVNAGHILDPKSGRKQMEDVMHEVMKVPTKRILFHQFSTGGYLYAQLLRVVALNPQNETFKKFHESIGAQIFDSPPDVDGIANGISKSFIGNPVMQTVSKVAVGAYLSLAKNTAGIEHREASRTMHQNTLRAPSLWFYSKADEIAPYQDCEKVIKTWRNNDIPVEECVWDDTPHIQHARKDPQRYFDTLSLFLEKHQLHA